ncbi:MAG TPA: DUF3108 domain-containing protein [Burkholderiales bacterium]|jgi:Protein of unknown function (DUF3108)|nr:DUF3108 domain-containing protein [Burkholderiales bacterium]
MRSWFSLLSSLPVAIAAAAPGVPPRIELHYELMRNGTAMAEVVERLEQGNGAYHLTETWKGQGMYRLLGRATRVSKGELAQLGPRPREFTDERSGRDTQRVTFDWSANTITRRYKGETRTEPVAANTQDRLSFLFALAYLAPKGEPVSFPIADARGTSHHTYKPNGRERLATPAGHFETLKVIRRKEGTGDVSEIWLAAELGYLPVRIVLVEDGGTRYEHMVTRVSR